MFVGVEGRAWSYLSFDSSFGGAAVYIVYSHCSSPATTFTHTKHRSLANRPTPHTRLVRLVLISFLAS